MINYYSTIEKEIFWKGIHSGWEKVSFKLWAALSERAGSIYDIGANTGIYALISATVNEKANIHSFEPSTSMFKKLIANVTINGFDNRIKCNQLAVSDKMGFAEFYDYSTNHQYSASLSKEMADTFEVEKHTYTVPITSIKEYMSANNAIIPDLLKIDVEMHEPAVLQGMGPLLKEHRPDFLIEVLSDQIGGQIESYFKDYDYLFYSIDEVNQPQRVEHILKGEGNNYLICKKSTQEFLISRGLIAE